MASAIPVGIDSDNGFQEALAPVEHEHHSKPDDDGRLSTPPTTSQSQSGDALDLEHRMATLIRNEKRIRYDKEKHMETHMSELCQETPGSRIYRCQLEVLSVCRCDYFDSECTLKCRFNGA
ncbi:hypothetical protein BGZ74_007976 [Mortierella antarctica]|nr:hypothetical protein BGZ74_007976 [Mortierella antarctica]